MTHYMESHNVANIPRNVLVNGRFGSDMNTDLGINQMAVGL